MKKYLVMAILLAMLAVASAQTTYTMDASHTSAHFRVVHGGVGYTFGRFNEFDGGLVYGADALDESSFEFFINVESIDTNNERRDGHLRSPDFFDAAQFPTIEFVSKSVSADGGDVYNVTGDLTVHGVTKEVTIPVTKTGESVNGQGKPFVGFYSEFAINRSDYGMTNLLEAASDEVVIMFSFEGVAE